MLSPAPARPPTGAPPRCSCGLLRPAGRPRCCNFCHEGLHSNACNMLQISLAEIAGVPVESRYVFRVA